MLRLAEKKPKKPSAHVCLSPSGELHRVVQQQYGTFLPLLSDGCS